MLLISVATNYITPKYLYVFALISFGFLWIYVIALIIVVVNIKNKTKFSKLFILTFVISSFYISRFVGFSSTDDKSGVSIMTYNVKVLGVYDDTKTHTKSKILNFISKENPDIICLQEFYFKEGHEDFFASMENIGYKYKAINTLDKNYKAQYFGLVTFSKFPIQNTKIINPNKSSNNYCIRTDIKTGSKSIAVYNSHMQSIHISRYDLDVDNYKSKNQFKNSSIALARKILKAYPKRTKLTNAIVEDIKQCKNIPSIVCCDLNDHPMSYSYNRFKSNMNEATSENSKGLNYTFLLKKVPIKIDNIFVDKSLTINYTNVYKDIKYSDHFPIISYVL